MCLSIYRILCAEANQTVIPRASFIHHYESRVAITHLNCDKKLCSKQTEQSFFGRYKILERVARTQT